MSETRIHRNGHRSTQHANGSCTTEGSMLVNQWTVDRVTERGAVVRLESETRYDGARPAGARDVTWVVFTGRNQFGGTVGTRKAARARIGA